MSVQVRISGTSNDEYTFRIRGAPAFHATYEDLADLFSQFPESLGQDVENDDVGTIDPQLILDGAPDVTHIFSATEQVHRLVNMAMVAKELDRRVVWY